MTHEEQKAALLQQIKDGVANEIATRGYQTKAEIDAAIEKSMDAIKTLDVEALRSISKENEGNKLVEAIRTIGEKVTQLEQSKGNNNQPLSIREQVAQWAKRNEKALESIKTGERASLAPLELRTPTTMGIAASLNSSPYLPNATMVPGVVDLVRVQPTFWNRLRKGSAKANPLYWVNKTNKEGNATFIGEGVLKPLASFELDTETSTPKKVAERMKVSTELLYDVDYMATMMEEELRFEVETAANAAVLTGVASSTSPAGITTIASSFNLTGISVIEPQFADCIRAAIAQIRSLNFYGTLTAYMNPIDIANMDMQKNSEGTYLMPPFTSAEGTIVKGVQVIEDNNIAEGYLLIGDMNLYKIVMHQDFTINFGWENDDFSKNLVTAIGEMRFHQYFSENHTGAWVYDTFANIKAAIAEPIV